MPNHNTAGSRVLPGIFLATLFAVTGLTACSGGGGSTTTSTPPATSTTYTITASTGSGGTVTPSGATTVAQGASQSYTITPGAGYAIATLVVDGTTVATSTTHTFTNVQANHTISATFVAAAPGGIVLSLLPARTSGVAPLAVFFDASATTDTGVTTRPFHDLEYTWSFGDPGSGTWASGAQPGVSSKNSATGPVTAHVFETPGTYTVSLTAFDGINTATTNTTITVQDPNTVFAGTNTICINASGSDFTGCPSGADTSTNSNFVTALSANLATHKRILFKRGDTFTAASSATLAVDGPGIIGAFGTNMSKPIVQLTGGGTNGTMLVLSSRDTPGIKDWRIMDLQFECMNQSGSRGISAWGGIDQLTILRTDIHDIEFGILLDGHVLDGHNTPVFSGHTLFDEIAIVDSTLTPIVGSIDTGGARLYLFAERLSVLGNTLGSTSDTTIGGSHVIRASIIQKGVIANNLIQRAGGTFLAIKMHAPGWCDVGSPAGICATPNWCNVQANRDSYPALCADILNTYKHATNTLPLGAGSVGYTEKVVVSDNKIIGYGGGYLVNIGPQNSIMDERVQDVIVERNWFKAGAQDAATGLATRSALVINSSEVTARNNICDLTGGGNARYCVNVRLNGPATPAPPPDNVRIYNNTAYSGDAAGTFPQFAGVLIETGATNVTVQNNLAFAPLASASAMINNTCGAACFTASHNSTDVQVKTVPPPFTAIPPTLITDWVVTAGSYAVSGGTVVPVWSDFFRTSRPQSGVIDLGAVERP